MDFFRTKNELVAHYAEAVDAAGKIPQNIFADGNMPAFDGGAWASCPLPAAGIFFSAGDVEQMAAGLRDARLAALQEVKHHRPELRRAKLLREFLQLHVEITSESVASALRCHTPMICRHCST